MSTIFNAMKANMARINELLELEDIDKAYIEKEHSYYDYGKDEKITFMARERNTDNRELTQRLLLLRKETIQFEKSLNK